VPLHGEHLGPSLHLERLDHTVVGGARHHQTCTVATDGLVVEAVGRGLGPVQLGRP
jgi:hypothetical protein